MLSNPVQRESKSLSSVVDKIYMWDFKMKATATTYGNERPHHRVNDDGTISVDVKLRETSIETEDMFCLIAIVGKLYDSLKPWLFHEEDNRRVIILDTNYLSSKEDVRGRLQLTLVQ